MFKLSISLWRATKIKWAHYVWTVSLDAFFWWAFCLSGSTRFPSFPFVPYSFLPSSLEGPPHAINFCLLSITLATPSTCVGPNSLVTPLHNLPVQCQYIPARWWLKGWQWYYNSTESSSTITTSRGGAGCTSTQHFSTVARCCKSSSCTWIWPALFPRSSSWCISATVSWCSMYLHVLAVQGNLCSWSSIRLYDAALLLEAIKKVLSSI